MTTQQSNIPDCQGMPPGFQSPCGIITEPHGPHPITAEQAVTPTSQDVSRRIDRMSLDQSDHNFIVGWITSAAPAALDDALDAVEIFRERRKQAVLDLAAQKSRVPACMCTGIEHDPGCARVAWARRTQRTAGPECTCDTGRDPACPREAWARES